MRMLLSPISLALRLKHPPFGAIALNGFLVALCKWILGITVGDTAYFHTLNALGTRKTTHTRHTKSFGDRALCWCDSWVNIYR